MGDYGLAISLPGYDVKTATLQQLAFSSKYPIFKIVFSGTLNVTSVAKLDANNAGVSQATFSHNLGYLPAFRCYVYADSGQTKRQTTDCYTTLWNGDTGSDYLLARVTTTQLIVTIMNWHSTIYTVPFYYFIYADSGS